MAITAITLVDNRSASNAALLDIEGPDASGSGALIAAGTQFAVNINVPWAASAADFPQHYLEIQLGGQTQFWIW
jgi:hypothetical protein